MKWYIHVISRYSDFTSRASRTEYWNYVFINLLFSLMTIAIDQILGTTFTFMGVPVFYGYTYALYALIVFIPGLAVGVRRLHDVGKSGWYYLLIFLPVIGFIWLLVLFVTRSQNGSNAYGPSPLDETENRNFSSMMPSR